MPTAYMHSLIRKSSSSRTFVTSNSCINWS